MLKLVNQTQQTNNCIQTRPSETKFSPAQISNAHAHQAFLSDIREFTEGLYKSHFQDLLHNLSCEIILEIRSSYSHKIGEHANSLETFVVSDLPPVDIQRIDSVIRYDEYLQAMLIIQFQLKILEQMLLFCEERDAAYLILNFHDSKLDYIEIYQNFLMSQQEIMTPLGDQTQIIIPADVGTYDRLLDFMDEVHQQFLQDLWRDHKMNTAYRAYLRTHAVLGL